MRVCPCGCAFARRDSVYRFLSPDRAEASAPFLRQYRTVRERDGFRASSADYYRALPAVPSGDARAAEWHIRAKSLGHLLRALANQGDPRRILDLGAGNGWLSNRLSEAGHNLVAVDELDDEADGLRACRHYSTGFLAVQADFNALPFEPSQFDAVVFNASLHSARKPAATLEEAHRMLAPGGAIVVMDSPMFVSDRDGRAMVADQARDMQRQTGLPEIVRAGVGYLTFADLDRAAARLGRRARFMASRGTLAWRVRRELGRLRLKRAPSAFGVWVAR